MENIDETIHDLHEIVKRRFIRRPFGQILDYADENGETTVPTPEECREAVPNALGWWTPVENGAFFTGLYLKALLLQYENEPDQADAAEIRLLAQGLQLLNKVSSHPGFIARGVADDGYSHYPFSSEDQAVPWVMGMHAYLKSDLCDDAEELKAAIISVIRGIRDAGWRIPTDIDGLYSNNWASGKDFRGVTKMLYLARLLYELTGDENDLGQYISLRDARPDDCCFTRLEITSHGFSADMVGSPSLRQFWICVCSHLALHELAAMDPAHADDFLGAAEANGVTALQLIPQMAEYDNETDGFSYEWRPLRRFWKPVGNSVPEAVQNALDMCTYWSEEIVPHRHMEHVVLGDAVFASWIAASSGNEKIRKEAEKRIGEAIGHVNWETLHLSYAFAMESALIYLKI